MKLASYVAGGKECYGVVIGDGVVTMKGHASLRDALAAGALDEMRKALSEASRTTSFPTSVFCRLSPTRTRILCAGVNYKSHAAEVGRELPKQPSMFIRFTDTLVGHEGEMIRPKLSDNFDFEGELTMVIGKGGRHIPIQRALDHVAGYTIFVDGSVRDYQKFSVTSGKNWPGTGPLGPWIVTADEIPDPGKLTLDHAAERPAGAALRHRQADLFVPADRQLLLGLHHAASRRRHRHRHARGRRPQPQAAALDETRRRAGGGDFRDRRAADQDRGRDVAATSRTHPYKARHTTSACPTPSSSRPRH